MAGRAIRRAALLLATGLATGLAARAHGADPDALLRSMEAKPLRYGGIMRGPLDGRLLLALDAPAPDGSLQGSAMLLTDDRRLIDTGAVSGTWTAARVPGGHDCTLRLSLTGRTVALHGLCATGMLSGEILDRRQGADWLTRQIFWWDEASAGGRYWLTEAAFYY
jgi:hypothetical protein